MSAADKLISQFANLATNTPKPLARFRAAISLLTLVRHNIRTDPAARERDISGFRPELVANDQRGEAIRHFRFHAACILLGPPGWLLSAAADFLDHLQARSGRAESVTECRNNIVGREVGHHLLAAMSSEMTPDQLRHSLKTLLHAPTTEPISKPHPDA